MPPTDGAATDRLCDALGQPIPGLEPVDGGPSWQPLVLLKIPGLDAIIGAVRPPLLIIAGILEVVAALLDALRVILIGIPDIFQAIILAAYYALKALLEDLINAGFYLYFDAPGITSIGQTPEALGIPTKPLEVFLHGTTGAPPPPPPPDRFAQWAQRFAASFDDPGDANRPVLSDGASVAGVFIMAAAPSLDALRQLLYLLGVLFNIKPFRDALDQFNAQSPDPDLFRARQSPVAPDWESLRLKDIFPPIQNLLAIPEALLGLLTSVDGLVGLIVALVDAIRVKVQTLQDLVAVIQAIIDLLDALQSAGLYALPVFTTEGVAGLQKAFVEAQNRPPGGVVAGVCILAAGPGIPGASVLFNMLGQGGALDQLEEALRFEQESAGGASRAVEGFGATATQAAVDMANEVERDPASFARSLGRSPAEVVDLARRSPAAFVQMVAKAKGPDADDALRRLGEISRHALRRGPRSLAFGLGTPPARAPSPEAKPPEPSDEDCGCEKKP